MPIARFQMPDGRIARFEVPDGTTPEQAQSLISSFVSEQSPRGTGSDALDSANAVSSGFNRGLARLAGLPVDTAANVLDLGKAALGSGYTAFTGKAPPESLQVQDRKGVVGSGDWMVDKIGRTSLGNALVNPANPEYEGGYLQAAGAGLNAVINPQSRAQALNQAALGVTSALGARAGAETGNPAWAVIGGLAPSGAQQALVAGTKYAVRGGEAGRKQMEQRIQDLRNAGIDEPTLGLASGNKVIGGMENILQSTPGAVGVMSRARDKAVEGLRAKSEQAADAASTNRGSLAAGQGIQGGIAQFRDSFKEGQRRVYGKLDEHIDSQAPTSIVNTRETLGRLNADITGAPNLSRFFKNEKIRALEDALQADTSGSPPSVQVFSQPPRAGGGMMNAPIPQPPLQVSIPAGPQRSTLPFEAVKKTRTLVGDELADHSLMSTVPQSKWKALYGSLSEDIGQTARATGTQAEQAFNRANAYTRAGMNRLEKLSPFLEAHHSKLPPEQAFVTLQNAARENVSILQAVKKSLPEGARGQVAGTIIDRLGRATNSNQNDTGTVWSPETFLTNWNKMTPRAREELFSGFPNAKQVKSDVESVAQATSMMRESSRMWANPSGTGANLAARGMLGAIGIGGATSYLAPGIVNPWLPAGIATGMLGANLSARALTSPGVLSAMTRSGNVSPGLLGTQAIPLFSTGLLAEQPQ
jgi:hypothetical protein